MRVLITGINGFVAGHLAEHLLAFPDYEIWGQSRRPTFDLASLHNRVQLLQADLLDEAAVAALLRQCQPDIVFHLAAQAAAGASFANPTATLIPNIVGQVNLCEALVKQRLDPLILVVGSADIYGIVQAADLPISEDTPLRPANPYAVSKATQDLLALQYYQSYRLRTIRLRPFPHIGPRQSPGFVAAAFAQQIARIEAGLQEPVLKVGNLSAERDFTDVRDMVAAYALAVSHASPGEAYNLGSGTGTTITALLDLLLESSRAAITVERDPERMRPVDVPRLVCDATRFQACTGWAPRIPLRQTLQDILADWRSRIEIQQL